MKPQNEALVITMEECGELIQACSKILRHGKSHAKLRDLSDEAGDVMCLIEILIERGYLTKNDLDARVLEKREKLKRYSGLFDNDKK